MVESGMEQRVSLDSKGPRLIHFEFLWKIKVFSSSYSFDTKPQHANLSNGSLNR